MSQVNLITAIIDAAAGTPNEEVVQKGLFNNGNTLILRGSQLEASIFLFPSNGEEIILEKNQKLRLIIDNGQNIPGSNSLLIIGFPSGEQIEFINQGSIEILATSKRYTSQTASPDNQQFIAGILIVEFLGTAQLNIQNYGSIICQFVQDTEINGNLGLYFFYTQYLPDAGNTGAVSMQNYGKIDISTRKQIKILETAIIVFLFFVEFSTIGEPTIFLNEGELNINIKSVASPNKEIAITGLSLFDVDSQSQISFINRGDLCLDLENINGLNRAIYLVSENSSAGTFENYGNIVNRQKFTSTYTNDELNFSVVIDLINNNFTNQANGRLILFNFTEGSFNGNIGIVSTENNQTDLFFRNKGTIYTGVEYQLNKMCVYYPECQCFLITKMYPVIFGAVSEGTPVVFINTGILYLYSPLQFINYSQVIVGKQKTIPSFQQHPRVIINDKSQSKRSICSPEFCSLLKYQQDYTRFLLANDCYCFQCAEKYFNNVELYNLR